MVCEQNRRLSLTKVVLLLGGLFLTINTEAFAPKNARTTSSQCRRPQQVVHPVFVPIPSSKWICASNDKDSDDSTSATNNNVVTKASWFAAEALGRVVGGVRRILPNNNNDGDGIDESHSDSPTSLNETLARLKMDNDRNYFLSGQVDRLIYDPDCIFADPFVSFAGRDRFVENLANLGSFITSYSARPLNYQGGTATSNKNDNGEATDEVAAPTVETKFMVKLELGNLPWKPVLAWPWGVECEIDPKTNLIVRHTESWDIDAWEVREEMFHDVVVCCGLFAIRVWRVFCVWRKLCFPLCCCQCLLSVCSIF